MEMSINSAFCRLRTCFACLCCMIVLFQGCYDVVDSNSGKPQSPENYGNVFSIEMADGPFDNYADPLCVVDRVERQGQLIYDRASP